MERRGQERHRMDVGKEQGKRINSLEMVSSIKTLRGVNTYISAFLTHWLWKYFVPWLNPPCWIVRFITSPFDSFITCDFPVHLSLIYRKKLKIAPKCSNQNESSWPLNWFLRAPGKWICAGLLSAPQTVQHCAQMRKVALAISVTHIPPNAVQSEAAKHAAHDYK